MGCGQSMNEDSQRSRQIGRELRRDFSKQSQIVKILLLGAGESGKSTIVKQMKLLHAVNQRQVVGFSDEEKIDSRKAIYSNVVESMVGLLQAMEKFGMSLDNNALEEEKFKVYHFAMDNPEGGIRPSDDVIGAIHNLWNNTTVQAVYQRRNEFQLNDSAAFFLGDVERVCKKDFIPTDQDILYTRVKTTGIVKIEFEFRKLTFHMFDVGGQRSERKKWIHCFDNVTAVLFIISMSEYDQVLFEEENTNRMQESLKLFSSVVNNVHFKLKPFIVFFNKRDLFEEKIKRKSITTAFPDYQGDPRSIEDTTDFIISKYLSQSKTELKHRAIYTHLTTATDTRLVNMVFTNVTEIILTEILKDIGLN